MGAKENTGARNTREALILAGLEELNEYILNDPKNDNANAADKEMKKIIRKLRNKSKQISEDLAELEKRKQKSEDINEIRQMLLDNLEDMLD